MISTDGMATFAAFIYSGVSDGLANASNYTSGFHNGDGVRANTVIEEGVNLFRIDG